MGKSQESPDTVGAANAQFAADRLAMERELEANRPNYYGPQSSTEWTKETFYDPSVDQAKYYKNQTHATLDPETGKYMIDPGKLDNQDQRDYYGRMGFDVSPTNNIQNWGSQGLQYTPFEAPHNSTRWEMETKLNEDWQKYVDMGMGVAEAEATAKKGIAEQWAIPLGSIDDMFGTTNPTIGADDWREFGIPTQTTGAEDWREFGTPTQTIGAGDWRGFGSTSPTTSATGYEKFGQTNPNIGAQDWRQFGTADPTITAGTFDERFGDSGDHGYGDHDMGGGDWNYIDYAPEYIRQQAQDSMYAYDTARLDPQFEQDRAELEIKLSNQGLAMGDQAYDAAMTSFNNNKNRAYEDARNQSMEASRMEAAMLWDQEMAASEQKNYYSQADIDNAYRGRQANIQNYLGGRQQDMQGYLDYSNAAYGQNFQNIQQQLDANREYSNEAYMQDLQARQQQLGADLAYSGQAYDQDFQSRQADIANNLRYGESAFNQDLMSKQYQSENDLRYGDQAFNQDLAASQYASGTNLQYGNAAYQQDYDARQQQMEAEYMREQILLGQYNALDPVGTGVGISQAIQGGQ